VQKRLKSTGFSTAAVLAEGHPAPQIIRAAQQRRVDLVVLGSRGMTGVKRFLVGSVSRKVARHAPCSVMVVRPKR
jgi:nucleotide-binding universal stress UspA family protein